MEESVDQTDADVIREQEEVRQILASAAALQAETSQSEWSEDDDDDLFDDDDDEEGRDAGDSAAECRGPLLGGDPDKPNAIRRSQSGARNRRRFRGFGLMSDRDAESTGYTTDDQAGMENLSVMNDAGLTDAEGLSIFSHSFDENSKMFCRNDRCAE